MILNQLGKIVEEEWLKTKIIRTNVDLDFFVVMPTHLHGILILNDRKDDPAVRLPIEITKADNETMQRIVFTTLTSNSLGAIIGQFKSICTKRIKFIGSSNFSWQSRFYDRIIRNETELLNIRRYIELNPLKWELEKGNPENIFPF